MPVLDHLGVTVVDLPRGIAQFGAVLTALGFEYEGQIKQSAAWYKDDETEIIVFGPRDADDADPHLHGRPGWQHLAFAVDSREEVERMHRVAVDAGWSVVREPKLYPRFNDRYYASFVEDDSGIRIEFMHNPPRES
ncbi:VOC family protein [Microbacterium sp. KUDC0406]|uniref:VOC family protein n=1 Tax=Microbacterium sp. KUDC0406 TaxID=2909588 RepID=UPI001F37D366|nr:VOC family protein [Microbacterium sp. KUDC0406]UJP09035.1 VOC family protein [Microbacterium sp. KUDC0406]